MYVGILSYVKGISVFSNRCCIGRFSIVQSKRQSTIHLFLFVGSQNLGTRTERVAVPICILVITVGIQIDELPGEE